MGRSKLTLPNGRVVNIQAVLGKGHDRMYSVKWKKGGTTRVYPDKVTLARNPSGTWYHGSVVLFDKFTRQTAQSFGPEPQEKAIFLTRSKDFAKLYSGNFGYIYTVNLKPGLKVFDHYALLDESIKPNHRYTQEIMTPLGKKLYDDLEDGLIFGDLEYAYYTFNDIYTGTYSTIEDSRFQKWLRNNGFNAFYVTGDMDDGQQNLGVLDLSYLEILDTERVISRNPPPPMEGEFLNHSYAWEHRQCNKRGDKLTLPNGRVVG